MNLLKRLLRRDQPDIIDLILCSDVDGLERRLRDDAPGAVKAAAEAIASLHEHGNEVTRERAEAASKALASTFERLTAAIARLPRGDYLAITSKADLSSAAWAVIDALGEIRAEDAAALLLGLVNDPGADVSMRSHAAKALGRIPGAGHAEALERLLDAPRTPDDLVEGAAAGLIALAREGQPTLRRYLLGEHSRTAASVKKALEHEVAVHGAQSDAAVALLNEAFAAEQLANRRRAERREAEDRAAVTRRIAAFPVAARMASLLGHPEWVASSQVVHPSTADAYREALVECRRLGMRVDEHERVLDNETSEVWADIEFEGESLLLDGGKQFRDVLY